MVLKHSKDGLPYREPPYSKEELRELEARIYKTPSPSLAQLVEPRSPRQRFRNNR